MVGFAKRPKVGMLLVTEGVIHALSAGDRAAAMMALGEAIERFRRADWGDVDEHDSRANDADLESGGRILAVYHVWDLGRTERVKLYIVHHVPFAEDGGEEGPTTICLPEEY